MTRTIREVAELAAVEPAWDALTADLPETHVSCLFPMVLASATRRHKDSAWSCHLAVGRQGALRQVLYGFETRQGLKTGLTAQAFHVATGHGSSVVLAEGSGARELRAIVADVFAAHPNCMFIEFPQVDRATLDALREAGARGTWLHTSNDTLQGFYFDTDRPYSEVFDRLGPKLRRNLGRERRRLEARHETTFDTVTSSDPGENGRHLDRYMDMEASGWKGREGTDSRHFEAEYYRDLVALGARSGSLTWYMLRADGKPVAMYLCHRHGRTLWAHKTTYDEAFATYSPGSQLLARMLEALCGDQGVDRLHMITSQPWVGRWRPAAEAYFRFRIYRKSVTGRALYTADWLYQSFGLPAGEPE